ncbi:MAG: efflux RND transporter permease subunit [Pseudomonadota bacterium]
MNPARLCIRRPVATAMVFLSLLVLGGLSARLLPLEMLPSIDEPILFINIPYPGSTPQETERLITRPAEEALATLKGVRFMNSNSRPTGSEVLLIFEWGKDVTVQAVEARERLDAIRDELPADVRRINVFKFSSGDQAMLTLRISSQRDLSEAYDMLTRNLVRPIERLEGVARVELEGVEPREIRIELSADRVDALGVDLEKLSARLQAANFAASAGMINEAGRRIRVNPVGEFRSLDEIRDLVINARGTRLGDIAEITFEPGERTYERHLDRNYAIGLSIYRERGSNLVATAERVLAQIAESGANDEMQGIELFFLQDQADSVVSSLRELLSAGLIGALLSMVVLYLFLRNLVTTMLVALAVPISITVTLGAMYLSDFTLNILSMMGLMLAVGMLIDNAVVVSEAIFTEREKTPADPIGAAERGVRSVGLAVVAGTLTSMAVFLPNLFGEMSQVSIFLKHVAFAICIALAMSLVLSQTLIPLVTTRVRPPNDQGVSWIDRLKARYAAFLNWTLGHRWPAWGAILLILVSVAVPIGLVKTDMFPAEEERDLFLLYNLDQKYPLDRVRPAVDLIEDYLYENKDRFEIDKVYTYFAEDGDAQSSILLKDDETATLSSEEIRELIRQDLPKIAIGKPSFEEKRTAGAEGVTISITGESSERLAELAEDVVFALAQIPGLRDVKTDLSAGEREVSVTVDRERAARYGISSEVVARSIAVALRGTQLSEYRGRDGEVPMTLRFAEEDSETIDHIRSLKLSGSNGEEIPLSALVNLAVKSGPRNINRQDRQTGLRITANLRNKTMDEVRDDIEQVMDQYQFPPGYGWKFGRGFNFNDDTAQRMVTNILLAVLFIYIIMAALFESLLHPLSIVTGIVFSVVGVYWFFLLTQTTFSLMAMIGILVLIGVVVNNGIVLIDHINQLRRGGMLRTQAVVQGGRDRLRPILMTVGTTVLGLLPLCFSTTQIGGDGPAYFPMARAIVGGLVFSTMISLCVLPTIYVTLDDLGLWAKRRWQAASRVRRFGGRRKRVNGQGEAA